MIKKVRRKWIVLLALVLFCFAGIQLIRPSLPNPPVTGNVDVPPAVEQILRKACFDCHSNETKLKWFDQVAPVSWVVASHVKDGRAALNFSAWDKVGVAERKASLFFAVNTVIAGEMPLPGYVSLHPEAKVTEADIAILKSFLLTLTARAVADSNALHAAAKQFEQWQVSGTQSVKPALNGIEFLPDYKNWTPISTTDRFDNNTMRVIMGNDIAVKAISEGNINPWPDGTSFAKVAWKQQMDSAGKISPGEFIQVEFMIKDHRKYVDTKGWGWARWKGMDLVPYGKTALFTAECVSCHRPMKDNDFVFTLPLKIKPSSR